MLARQKSKFKIWLAKNKVRPHFDADYYKSQSRALAELTAEEALAHFCEQGWQDGLSPNPEFSTRRYLKAYDDVYSAGINPFYHYLKRGQAENRQPRPRIEVDDDLDVLRPYFDYTYYRTSYFDMERHNDEYLLEHFHIYGWREGRDPNPFFSCVYYLKENPDVRVAGINPYLHYLNSGRAEGRQYRFAMPRRWPYLMLEHRAIVARYFDPVFYSKQVPGLEGDTEALIRHYVEHGWRDGLDPSARFSGEFYTKTYRDALGVCPLLHFLFQYHGEARRGIAGGPKELVVKSDANTFPELNFPFPKDCPATEGANVVWPSDPEVQGLDLHWVVPDFSQGGGGHMTIFRTIRYLENFGHRCTVWLERPIKHRDTESAYQDIVRYFQCLKADVRFVQDGLAKASGDAIIATAWSTAYHVNAAQNFKGKFYFVQDYEPEFYPTGSERFLAARTYEMGLACICASPWLERRLRAEHNLWTRSFSLAFDHNIYRDKSKETDDTKKLTLPSARFKIAVYAREHTARRCVHLAVLALIRLGRLRDDFEVHFFGQETLSFHETNFVAYSHGILSEDKLATLYNECDLALCFSGTNYSLVPQEMMACGLPLIELDTESTRQIFPDGVVSLAGPEPEDICVAIGELLDSPDKRANQAANAAGWVSNFSWEQSARQVEAAICEYIDDQTGTLSTPRLISPRETLLDVVIPTFNGIGELEPVIDALRQQDLGDGLKIHCIDSSSSDGTREWLQHQKDISLTVIPQSEFQHGRTRNVGAGLGTAPFIAFLTQDARPSGSNWANDLLKMLGHYENAAGVFGRHLPYPGHSPFVVRDINQHFENLLTKPLVVSRATDGARWESGDLTWRQFLHFYSDNNSAMRRTVWEEIPYPEIDYGEDQVWAREIIEAGYAKIYAPTASVYHSHDYGPAETYKRSFIEGAFFYTHFGYELGQGTDEEIQERLQKQCDRDAEWGHRNSVPESLIERQKEVLAAKQRGWRDGRLSVVEQG